MSQGYTQDVGVSHSSQAPASGAANRTTHLLALALHDSGPRSRLWRFSEQDGYDGHDVEANISSKRLPPYFAMPIQHHQHHQYRVACSRSSHAVAHARVGGSGGAASPRAVPMPMQCSGLHGVPFVSPVPYSAKRWARARGALCAPPTSPP